MSNHRVWLHTAAIATFLFASSARANFISFEPDDFAVGAVVTTVNPLVSLSTFRSSAETAHVPVFAPVYVADCSGYMGCVATTGTRVFGDAFGGIEEWGAFDGAITDGTSCFRALARNTDTPACHGIGLHGDFNLLLMTFTASTDFVQISGAYNLSDETNLYGFDDQFNLVGSMSQEFLNRPCSGVEFYCTLTVTLTSQSANIRYALAGGWSNGTSLDNLRFRSVPEPGTLGLLVFALVGAVVIRRRIQISSDDRLNAA